CARYCSGIYCSAGYSSGWSSHGAFDFW
nr:immunoglobulin heavy chain junction region [Macaca mulatta]MOW33340.1 immunoglobulin heavy chain junction region [Macaca mulatta]